MKRSASAILFQLALLSLALPVAAGAKNVQSATICGASGCHEAMGRDVSAALVEGGDPAPPPSGGAPWYSVRAAIGGDGGHGITNLAVVPRLGLIRGCCATNSRYFWISMTGAGERAYARLTRALDPFPASSLRGVARAGAEKARASHRRSDPRSPISAAALADSGGGIPVWGWILIGACVFGVGLVMERRRRTSRRAG